jgi:cell division protein FtsB
LVHQLALDYFAQDVRQNLDEQSQDEHLTLVVVVLVVIFQEFFLVHLDELVLQVVVVRHHLN